jgi:hypothetical protein
VIEDEGALVLFSGGQDSTVCLAWALDRFRRVETIGFNYGRADAMIPGSWELGYLYQSVEKDALFGQWIDSDFASGNTDGRGGAVRGAWQIARSRRINATYMFNETNVDVPAVIILPVGVSGIARRYDRLQVDLNWAF